MIGLPDRSDMLTVTILSPDSCSLLTDAAGIVAAVETDVSRACSPKITKQSAQLLCGTSMVPDEMCMQKLVN